MPALPAGETSPELSPAKLVTVYRRQIIELSAIIDVLKGAAGIPDDIAGVEVQPWMLKLTRQERALVGALLARSPRVTPTWELLEALPGYLRPEDRQPKLVTVLVSKIRKKLKWREVISNAYAEGYYMTPEAKSRLLAL